jgi:hypothetical protein
VAKGGDILRFFVPDHCDQKKAGKGVFQISRCLWAVPQPAQASFLSLPVKTAIKDDSALFYIDHLVCVPQHFCDAQTLEGPFFGPVHFQPHHSDSRGACACRRSDNETRMEGSPNSPTQPAKPGVIIPPPFSSASLELSLSRSSGSAAAVEGTVGRPLSAIVPQPFPSASATAAPLPGSHLAFDPARRLPPEPQPAVTLSPCFTSPFDMPAAGPPMQPAAPPYVPLPSGVWDPCGVAVAAAPPSCQPMGSSTSHPAVLVPTTPTAVQECQPTVGAAAYPQISPVAHQEELQQAASVPAGPQLFGGQSHAVSLATSSTLGGSFTGHSAGMASPTAAMPPASSGAAAMFGMGPAQPQVQAAAYPGVGLAQPAVQGGTSFSSLPSSCGAGLQPGGNGNQGPPTGEQALGGEQQALGPLEAGATASLPDFAYPGRPGDGEGKLPGLRALATWHSGCLVGSSCAGSNALVRYHSSAEVSLLLRALASHGIVSTACAVTLRASHSLM